MWWKILAVQSISKFISNSIISDKIDEIVQKVRRKIEKWYIDYRLSVFISIVLNSIIVGITLISFYLFSINYIAICIISIISIFMLVRTIVRWITALIRTVIPNFENISLYGNIFSRYLVKNHSVSRSIRNTINIAFMNIYTENTNKFVRGLHNTFSFTGFIKSKDEISEIVVNEFYGLITGITVRLIIYKIIAFTLYISVFTFLLKPFVFTQFLDKNILQIIIYPFTVALPTVISIFFK
jgi:hypothetical protein